MYNAREIAIGGLSGFRRNGSWPDLYLKQEGEKNRLSAADMALATTLVYGTLQNLHMIDFYISHFSDIRINRISPQVLDAMRMAIFQLVYLDRIPDSAAVNETVNIVKKSENPKTAGFANAVLRKIAQNRDELPQPDKSDLTAYLATKYSHEYWFSGKMRKKLGDDGAEALLLANNTQPMACIRVNTLKTTVDKLIEEFSSSGIEATVHSYIPDCLCLPSMRGAIELNAFKNGHFYVQDGASQQAVFALAPTEGDSIIDMCAAPGGKSLMAAQLMGCKGKILAMDIHPHKTEIIEENARKMGIDIITTVAVDASRPVSGLIETADKIICDVPCSGVGIIRKKPDIRFKEYEALKELPALQYSILQTAAEYLKCGGTVVYSTCSVLTEENEKVVAKFIEENPNFSLCAFDLPGKGQIPEGMVTLYPHIDGTDGFFIAKLKKK